MRGENTFKMRVDVANIGHYLACCGIFDLADRWWPGGAEGWFEGQNFHVRCADTRNEITCEHPLATLLTSNVTAVADLPGINQGAIEKAIAPLCIRPFRGDLQSVQLDAWFGCEIDGTTPQWSNTPWKFWVGHQTSLSTWSNISSALRTQCSQISASKLENIFWENCYISGRFGYDPGPAWKPLDVGFSPNDQSTMEVCSSPAVELLAAVGLQRFRPHYSRKGIIYATWPEPLPVTAAMLAMANRYSRVGVNVFRCQIIDRGKIKALSQSVLVEA
jgi:hypothetical protein